MCMMKNSGEKEACEVANSLAALDGHVTKVEERILAASVDEEVAA